MRRLIIATFILALLSTTGCGGGSSDGDRVDQSIDDQEPLDESVKGILLHHSTGAAIWDGGVSAWFSDYNTRNGKMYSITEMAFPKNSPYGWNNYPYDYWNIWVNHEGYDPFIEEPTLEILTQDYNVIIWKHCYPVSSISPDTGNATVQSSDKRIENYKLQYQALRTKMRSFPETRFIVWTGAANAQGATSTIQATLARSFFQWVKNEWDEPGDNIYVWDFFELETGGGIFLRPEYASSSTDSHPNSTFSQTVAPLLCKRIVDVIQGRGDTGSITGQ